MTQVQKAEKYIVVKVMKISDGSAQKALREFGPDPPRGQRVKLKLKRLCTAVGHNSRKSKSVSRFTRLQLTS